MVEKRALNYCAYHVVEDPGISRIASNPSIQFEADTHTHTHIFAQISRGSILPFYHPFKSLDNIIQQSSENRTTSRHPASGCSTAEKEVMLS